MEKFENLNSLSDIELYDSFLDGNQNAFNILIIRYRKKLTHFLLSYVKKIDIAEDIAQDSFLYIIINKNVYDFKYSFQTYLYTIAKSRAINYLKRNKKTLNIKEDISFLEDIDFDLEYNYIKKETYSKIANYIKKLKKDYQIIIYLFYYQNFKYKEICKITNFSMSKVKMTIHRAKKTLEIYLKEDDNYDE